MLWSFQYAPKGHLNYIEPKSRIYSQPFVMNAEGLKNEIVLGTYSDTINGEHITRGPGEKGPEGHIQESSTPDHGWHHLVQVKTEIVRLGS